MITKEIFLEYLNSSDDIKTRGSNSYIKAKLLKYNIFENKCDICNFYKWNNEIIPLELHHKDGNYKNNKLSNLQLLCPNCHAQTDTYRGKNKK